MEKSGKESGKRQFVMKKAYEISYAVFRIASRIGSTPLKDHLERQALSLLDAATVENYAWVSMVSRAIEYLVRFGSDIGIINEANKETILSQLAIMSADVLAPEKSGSPELIPLDDIFSPQEPLFKSIRKYSPDGPAINPAIESAIYPANESGNALKAETRQATILDKIRQSGNCRLRDLQEILPDCSERTIRYDLQTLTEQNLVERVGSGGPAVFYRIRQTA